MKTVMAVVCFCVACTARAPGQTISGQTFDESNSKTNAPAASRGDLLDQIADQEYGAKTRTMVSPGQQAAPNVPIASSWQPPQGNEIIRLAKTNQGLVIIGDKIIAAPKSFTLNPPFSEIYATNDYFILTTPDGNTYEVLNWLGANPANVTIEYIVRGNFGGLHQTQIPLEYTPKEIQAKYHYDRQKAIDFLTEEAVQQAAYEQQVKDYVAQFMENQKLKALQDEAAAIQQEAIQQKRLADAAELQAQAAMIQATNTPQVNVYQQQNNNVLQIQQNQQNNFGN